MIKICELLIGKEVIEKCIIEHNGFGYCRFWICEGVNILLIYLVLMIMAGGIYFIYKKIIKRKNKNET